MQIRTTLGFAGNATGRRIMETLLARDGRPNTGMVEMSWWGLYRNQYQGSSKQGNRH